MTWRIEEKGIAWACMGAYGIVDAYTCIVLLMRPVEDWQPCVKGLPRSCACALDTGVTIRYHAGSRTRDADRKLI